jgi:bifunctional UDP-N-acetylglucosamine pyrophosphorylase/glucosamine-1-phosphate N-acetyltransferase
MKSNLLKMLHKAAGKPLLGHMIDIARQLSPEKIILVVGHQAEAVKKTFADADDLRFVLQAERLGTGHALKQAQPLLEGFEGSILVLNGDGPLLLKQQTLDDLLAAQPEDGMAVLTCHTCNPTGLGRIVRSGNGEVTAIVEEKDADATQRAIQEINTGIFIFNARVLEFLDALSNDNAQGEYYITELVALYLGAGLPVNALMRHDEDELLNCLVNDRTQLARVERLLRDRTRSRWLGAGVTMIAPEQTFIDETVTLEKDVILYPGVWLMGNTHVAEGAVIMPHAVLTDCQVEASAVVAANQVLSGEHV